MHQLLSKNHIFHWCLREEKQRERGRKINMGNNLSVTFIFITNCSKRRSKLNIRGSAHPWWNWRQQHQPHWKCSLESLHSEKQKGWWKTELWMAWNTCWILKDRIKIPAPQNLNTWNHWCDCEEIWNHLVNSSNFTQLLEEEMDVDIELQPDLIVVAQSGLCLSCLLPLAHLQSKACQYCIEFQYSCLGYLTSCAPFSASSSSLPF